MPPPRAGANRLRDRFQLAQALHRQGRLADAGSIYQEILRADSRHADALHFLGLIALQTNRAADGVRLIEQAIALKPNYAEAYGNLGLGYVDLARTHDALASYDKAIALNPDLAEVHDNRGNALRDLGRYETAVASHDRAIALRPNDAGPFCNRGNALKDLDRYEDALASYDRAIALQPGFLEARCNRGILLHALRRYDNALTEFDQVIARAPNYPEAHNGRGNVLQDLQRYEDALTSFGNAIAAKPDYAEAHNNLGNALQALHRYEEALAAYAHSIAVKPDYAEAHNNHGNALHGLKRPQEALISYARAIALRPDYAEAHYNRGNALQDLRRHQQALASFDKAVALKPGHAEAYNNRGNTLHDLRRIQDALLSYAKAVALKPDYAEAYYNIGNALAATRCEGAALVEYDHAVALKPDYADAWRARGLALNALKRYREALANYERALALKPGTDWLPGDILSAKRQICDWASDADHIGEVLDGIGRGRKVTPPFTLIGLSPSPACQRKAAEIFARNLYPENDELPPLSRYDDHQKIRIGYFSADFHEHPMMHVMIELFGCHDRSRFELTAFSFGPDTLDEWRQRVRDRFDRFIDVQSMADRDIALLARSLEIDIAIDLMGFTMGCRTGIFSYRAAPVQVNYLGYPGTMGADYIDYIIADRVLIPSGAQIHYCEKIVFLPDSYQVNGRQRPISCRTFTRAEQGLPDAGFVFCCFNNNYKISPQVFDGWMRILQSVEASVLWLYEENADAAVNLRQEALARNVAPERLVFAQKLPLAEHLARHRLADLFLDTLPYNGHATAGLALWAGLPVLTRIGETLAGRVAASLLNAVGLPELITTTQDAYEALAIELATCPDRLHALRTKLGDNRLTTPLFDTVRFTRHLEAAYAEMHRRVRVGMAPADIGIDALHDQATVRRKNAEEPDA